MKKLYTLLLFLSSAYLVQAQLNLSYVSQLSYNTDLNDIWGYVAPDGTEYALVGARNGTSIVSLADPTAPVEVDFVPGDQSMWRDIKTWGETAYVTCDEGNDGLVVIDLSNLPNSVTSYSVNNIPSGTLNRCHNIYIDELGYAYLAGCNLNSGGRIIMDCFTTPGTPQFVSNGPSTYSHDVYTRDNLMYSSEIDDGVFTVYDVTDKSDIIALGDQVTPFAFTHNAWLSDDGNILFTTDELANAPVGAYDVSDPTDIQFLDSYAPFATLGEGVIPHNVHVWQNWLIVSYYTDGCIIIDATYPDNLVEVGNFDTFIPSSTGFLGVWGAYPFLPSGLVLCSDIGNGLYVLEPNYVQACYLHGDVTDAVTGAAITGARATFMTTPSFGLTDATGEFKTGIATAGTYNVEFYKAGYERETIEVSMVNGEITTVSVELTPATPFTFSGTVVEAGTNTAIPNAPVKVYNESYDFNVLTDTDGNFTIENFYEDIYTVASAKWGFSTAIEGPYFIDETNNTNTLELSAGYEDVFSFDLGWAVSSTASSGIWERGKPIGVSGGGILLTPGEDVPDVGNECYVTGNTDNIYAGFLTGGSSTLTSPVFDISDYEEPMINYSYWFLSVNLFNQSLGSDELTVSLSNGTDTIEVANYLVDQNFNLGWFNSTDIKIDSLIDPSDNMTFWITATATGNALATESALDHWSVWDAAATSSVNSAIDERIALKVYPNPSDNAFYLDYDLENKNEGADLRIMNALGQVVYSESLVDSNGTVQFGADLPKGIYFAQIQERKSRSTVLKLIKE